MSQEDLGHHLMPRDEVMYTIVIENSEKKITDFVSFYNLPSQILKREGHNHTMMKIAYLYYYSFSEQNSLLEIMKFAIWYAKEKAGFDVFNCLSIMDNAQFIQELKFGCGDGTLNFYLYNYKIKDMYLPPSLVGTVLV